LLLYLTNDHTSVPISRLVCNDAHFSLSSSSGGWKWMCGDKNLWYVNYDKSWACVRFNTCSLNSLIIIVLLGFTFQKSMGCTTHQILAFLTPKLKKRIFSALVHMIHGILDFFLVSLSDFRYEFLNTKENVEIGKI